MSLKSEKIAEEVLWQIALTRAETRELKFLVVELISLKTGKAMTDIQDKHKAKKEDAAKSYFLKAAKATGLGNPPIPNHNGEV